MLSPSRRPRYDFWPSVTLSMNIGRPSCLCYSAKSTSTISPACCPLNHAMSSRTSSLPRPSTRTSSTPEDLSPATSRLLRTACACTTLSSISAHEVASRLSQPVHRTCYLRPVSYTHLRAHETRHDIV